MSAIVLPIVHANGTSLDRLIDQLQNAVDAINTAYSTLREAAPNGRDYYPVPGLMEKAQAQHQRRLKTLQELGDELESAILALDDYH